MPSGSVAGERLGSSCAFMDGSLQQVWHARLRRSRGSGQSQLGQIEREQTGDVVAFRAGHLFLRLHHFDRGGHAGGKAVARFG